VLKIAVEGVELGHWQLSDIKRRHALTVQAKLLEHGRSAEGATGILRAMSALTNDAIDDELCDANPWLRLGIRSTDPRLKKAKRPVRVWAWDDMRAFAAATGPYEPAVRLLSDCGLRLGELLPLKRSDLSEGLILRVERTAHEGRVLDGTKTTHDTGEGRDVPLAPTVAAMLKAMPPRIDTPLLFPTPTGLLWRERNFRRDVWAPAVKATGMDIRPHEMRHSFISLMRAAGVDPADLAEITGHSVETMHGRYTHPLRRSFDQVRAVVG
jgi:integrase